MSSGQSIRNIACTRSLLALVFLSFNLNNDCSHNQYSKSSHKKNGVKCCCCYFLLLLLLLVSYMMNEVQKQVKYCLLHEPIKCCCFVRKWYKKEPLTIWVMDEIFLIMVSLFGNMWLDDLYCGIEDLPTDKEYQV